MNSFDRSFFVKIEQVKYSQISANLFKKPALAFA